MDVTDRVLASTVSGITFSLWIRLVAVILGVDWTKTHGNVSMVLVIGAATLVAFGGEDEED